jgi:hypothetical protein
MGPLTTRSCCTAKEAEQGISEHGGRSEDEQSKRPHDSARYGNVLLMAGQSFVETMSKLLGGKEDSEELTEPARQAHIRSSAPPLCVVFFLYNTV